MVFQNVTLSFPQFIFFLIYSNIFHFISYAVQFQITDCMLRTLKNLVDITADAYKIPYLKIDLMYEETGIEIVPRVLDIVDMYHRIIDDVSTHM